jgi:hypothetical protein
MVAFIRLFAPHLRKEDLLELDGATRESFSI